MMGSVDSIETFGLVDGPGIRTVVFLTGCKLRCKYCHNPETWKMGKPNMTADELARKIIRNKPYFKRNSGGVTFSGGEPLLQSDFIIEVCKILKKEQIHVALDTAGVGNGDYEKVLEYVDLILLDVKHTNPVGYKNLTGGMIDETLKFIEVCNKMNKEIWIRQVIVPGIMDNDEYLDELVQFVKKVNNVQRIDFLPYHKLGDVKYDKLGIINPFASREAMDKDKCDQLYLRFIEKLNQVN